MKTITKFLYLVFAALAVACFALSPTAQAVTPAPDGGYPNENTAEGTDALLSLTTGFDNTATGFQALYSNTDGYWNTATGFQALYSNTTGVENTGNGYQALLSNTTGVNNTATGFTALISNTTGIANTANGGNALPHNTEGAGNTATGQAALFSNETGNNNTAVGATALFSNQVDNTTAVGAYALASNTTGDDNTAVGFSALGSNMIGFGNTAVGVVALASTTAPNNTAVGTFALTNTTTGFTNTAVGQAALFNNTTGWENVALGAGAGLNLTTGHSNIVIGSQVVGVAGESNTIRIGKQGTQTKAFIAGINGAAVMGAAVKVSASGQLGTAPSSQRFKEKIRPMDTASEAILALKPVTFRYKKEIDPEGIAEFGLVAEDVEKVNPDLVVRDAQGKVYTVRYDAVNAMLLNEFLKEHRTVQELKSTVQKQQNGFQSKLAEQQKQIEALTTGLQRVNDQIELSKPAPQTVLNNQ